LNRSVIAILALALLLAVAALAAATLFALGLF
jgi:hypothetical protein